MERRNALRSFFSYLGTGAGAAIVIGIANGIDRGILQMVSLHS
jgi:hypothetical protein